MVQGELAKALEEGRAHIREATVDLKDAIREQSRGAARVIREEAAHIRRELGEFTGNNAPEDEEEPPRTEPPKMPELEPPPEPAPQPEPEPVKPSPPGMPAADWMPKPGS